MNKRQYALATIHLLLFTILIACAPIRIPTSDVTPTAVVPASAVPTSIPTATPGTGGAAAVSPTAAASPTPLPEGGSIVVGAVSNFGWDVNSAPAFLQSALYNSLLRPNPATGALEPDLAESFQISGDGLTFTFHLRANVRWHNGDLLTADDVATTLNAFASPDFRGTPVTDFGPFVRATAPDSRTVQATFREPYCSALTSIGTLKILPRSIALSSNFPRLLPEQLVGTGPLRLQASSGDQYVFTRNENYYAGAPHIQTWTLKLYPDAAGLRAAFAAGSVDVMSAASQDFGATKKIPGATLWPVNASEMVMLLFNYETPGLDDPRVRQALAYALDRGVLLADIAKQGALVDGSTLPAYWANPGDLPRYPFDVARALQLLAEAGWRPANNGALLKDGKPLAVQLWTEADDPILEPLAFRIREMYAALGIQVEMELDDRPGWITRAFQHRFDLLLLTRPFPLDPDQHWYWQSDQNTIGNGYNFGSYAAPRVDAIGAETARVAGCAASGRGALFAEMNRTLIADAPAVFLFAPQKYLVTRERVLNATPSTFAGDFANLNQWAVKP